MHQECKGPAGFLGASHEVNDDVDAVKKEQYGAEVDQDCSVRRTSHITACVQVMFK